MLEKVVFLIQISLYNRRKLEQAKSDMIGISTGRSENLPKRQIGYTRTSQHDHSDDGQLNILQAAGCNSIYEETNPDTSGPLPVLARVLRELEPGDTLVVARFDRLALSAAHLLDLIRGLCKRGIGLRSVGDGIDTSTPDVAILLNTLVAVVKLERSLAVERTIAGMQAAKARGRVAGNPALRERRPEAREAVSRARDRAYLEELLSTAPKWLPVVRQMRPQHGWDTIVEVLARRGEEWSVERLRRAVRRLVKEKKADPELLDRSLHRVPDDRLMKLAAAIAIADPGLSLRGIAAELDLAGEHPPRGGKKWQASSIRNLLNEARRYGLIRD